MKEIPLLESTSIQAFLSCMGSSLPSSPLFYLYFLSRSFSEISDPTKHMAKCQELCKLLAHDMEREEIQVGWPLIILIV